MKRNQSGFTLIEIAIVLVIIGLLLGGILKGQELINSAKVKNLANDFKNIPVYIYGYQDKYKALPGDDIKLAAHLGASAVACTPNGVANACVQGNGVIDGTWNATTVADESYVFWQHIRMAGFGPGSTDTTNASGDYIPTNAVGGIIGVTNAAQSPITGLTGTYIVCSNSIPGKFAKQLDTTLDDGNTAAGSLMVATNTTGGAPIQTTNIVDDTTYLVCMGY
jgi:prepilin-type N-terminal cleavage/methylation domain-containing protein